MSTYAGAHFEGVTWDAERFVYRIEDSSGGSGDDLLEVLPLIYTAAIVLTDKNTPSMHFERWCYHSIPAAIAAAQAWDRTTQDEPAGWHRHPASGRRRPDGDATREYVEF